MPTTAEVQASITAVIKVVNDLFTYSSGDFTDESIALKATYQSDYEFIADIQSALDGTRDTLSSTISTVSAIIEPLISEYARLADTATTPDKASWAQTGFDEIWARLYRFAADQTTPLTVESRAFTWTEPTIYLANASTITDGRAMVQVYRDSYDYDIETATAEDIEGRCVIDVNRGAEVQQETFELSGEAAPLDNTVQGGTGLITSITGLSCSDSTAFISNPSFTSYVGTTTAVTGLSGWTVGSATPQEFGNINIDETTVYRSFSGEGATPASLKIIPASPATSESVKQVFSDLKISFNADTPYYVHVAHYHPTGTAGSLILTWGGVSVTTVLNSGNDNQWNLTRIGASAATQKNCWLRQFDVNDAEIKIEVTGITDPEYVLIDDVTIGPMTQYGAAQWYALVGGTTPFLEGDYLGGSASATAPWTAVTGGTSGINQRWFAELFGAYLPSTTGTPTWAEPT